MNSNICKIGLGIAVVAILCSACLVTPESRGNKSSLISGLEAEYTSVYPKGASEIRCVVSDPGNETLQFKWSSTGGSLIGDGATVTWQAPNDYGDYHIMVVAQGSNGESDEATLTMSVVPRAYRGCCGKK